MWLLEQDTLRQLRDAVASKVIPTADQQAELVALHAADDLRILSKAGNRAQISITGVLTAAPSFLARFLLGGNTTYGEIVSALAEADRDPEIEHIDLFFDTPGGQVAGLFDTVAAIQATNTPTTARIGNQAASAGFILAAVADEVVALNRASSVGSFGVAMDAFLDEDIISITNTESPDKRPNLSTEEGQAVVREYLDAVHELFTEAVADGRGVSTKKVNSDFGRGAMVLADEAVRRGMIDRVGTLRAVPSKQTASGGQPEKISMDLNKLKAEHPDVFAAAVQEGVTQERDRVLAHLTLGEGCGDLKIAVEAIKGGEALTMEFQSKYLTAGMNREDIARRQQESDAAAAAAAAGGGGGRDADGQLAARLRSHFGITG